MRTIFVILLPTLAIAAAIAALVLLDRLLLWMEAREWICWRKRKPKGGGGGISATLTAMHQLVEPEVRHVIEERDQRRTADTSDQGAPPGENTSPGPLTRRRPPATIESIGASRMSLVLIELIEDPDEGGFTARVPDIPAYGEGETEEQAIADLRDALKGYIQTFGLEDAMARMVAPRVLPATWNLAELARG